MRLLDNRLKIALEIFRSSSIIINCVKQRSNRPCDAEEGMRNQKESETPRSAMGPIESAERLGITKQENHHEQVAAHFTYSAWRELVVKSAVPYLCKQLPSHVAESLP